MNENRPISERFELKTVIQYGLMVISLTEPSRGPDHDLVKAYSVKIDDGEVDSADLEASRNAGQSYLKGMVDTLVEYGYKQPEIYEFILRSVGRVELAIDFVSDRLNKNGERTRLGVGTRQKI